MTKEAESDINSGDDQALLRSETSRGFNESLDWLVASVEFVCLLAIRWGRELFERDSLERRIHSQFVIGDVCLIIKR